MRHFIIIFCTIFTVSSFAQQSAYSEFMKAHDEDAALSINIPLSSISKFIDEDDLKQSDNFIKNTEQCRLSIFSNKSKALEGDFQKFIKRHKFKKLIRVKDGKDKLAVYFIEKNELIKEIVFKANSDDDNVVMFGVKTSITKDELAEMMD